MSTMALTTPTTEPTLQQRMQSRLESCGLPYKEIKVYGSQIMVTAWSYAAARKWHSLLFKICTTVRPPGESRDYNKVNEGTNLCPTTHEVWRVWGTFHGRAGTFLPLPRGLDLE